VSWSTLCRARSLSRAAGATPLRPSSLREACGERASGSIIDGPRQERPIAGSTTPRSLDELAQLRTHTAHYSPVMIAPLSINSSHRLQAERSFFLGIPNALHLNADRARHLFLHILNGVGSVVRQDVNRSTRGPKFECTSLRQSRIPPLLPRGRLQSPRAAFAFGDALGLIIFAGLADTLRFLLRRRKQQESESRPPAQARLRWSDGLRVAQPSSSPAVPRACVVTRWKFVLFCSRKIVLDRIR
jgi:hypothetical protein